MSSRPSMMNPKMTPSNRGLKILGARVSDILDTVFPKPVAFPNGPNQQPQMTPNGGKISRSDFIAIWEQISAQGNSSEVEEFIKKIFTHFKTLIESKQNSYQLVTINTFVNTFAFIILYTQLRVDHRNYKDFINFWNTEAPEIMKENASINNMVALLTIPSETEFSKIASQLVIGASTLMTSRELAPTYVKPPTFDESDIPSNEHGFIYSYLTQMIQSCGPEFQVSVLNAILNKTLSLPQQMKTNPDLAENTMLALFHMARQFLCIDAIKNVSFIKHAISVIQPFFMWPQPYGFIARSLIENLQSELLCPGWNRRKVLLQESACVDYKTNLSPIEAVPSPYNHPKPIFYIFDSSDQTAVPLLNILHPSPYVFANVIQPAPTHTDASGGLILPASVQSQAILHAIDTEVPCQNGDLNMFKHLSVVQINDFFLELQKIDQTIISSEDPSRNERIAQLTKLKEKIKAAAVASGFTPTPDIPNDIPSASFCPPLPLIEHVRVAVPLDNKSSNQENSDLTYPWSSVYDKLSSLILGYVPDPSIKSAVAREIRIVIVGNDSLLHQCVAAYHIMCRTHPEYFVSLKPKFFIVPCTRNHVANYIARQDAWYFRHIYSPFRSNALLLPWFRDDDGDIFSDNNVAPIKPASYLRDCVTQYVREANFTLDCSIFQIECYTTDHKGEDQPDIVIPFLQRIEIGLTPAIEEYRIKNRKPLNMKPDEALKDKTFLYQSLDLGVRFNRLDLAGRRQPEVADEPAPYSSILLSNIPRKSDLCFPADPASKGLELYAQGYKGDKSKKKGILALDPKQHVSNAFISCPTKFRMLVDGYLYGPYAAVRVSMANNNDKDKTPSIFPIQTFFPMN